MIWVHPDNPANPLVQVLYLIHTCRVPFTEKCDIIADLGRQAWMSLRAVFCPPQATSSVLLPRGMLCGLPSFTIGLLGSLRLARCDPVWTAGPRYSETGVRSLAVFLYLCRANPPMV